nr:MAG TPA: hypothetical protein [Caudoviricetes sp.]
MDGFRRVIFLSNRPGLRLNIQFTRSGRSLGDGLKCLIVGADILRAGNSTNINAVGAKAGSRRGRNFKARISNVIDGRQVTNKNSVICDFSVFHIENRTAFNLLDGGIIGVTDEVIPAVLIGSIRQFCKGVFVHHDRAVSACKGRQGIYCFLDCIDAGFISKGGHRYLVSRCDACKSGGHNTLVGIAQVNIAQERRNERENVRIGVCNQFARYRNDYAFGRQRKFNGGECSLCFCDIGILIEISKCDILIIINSRNGTSPGGNSSNGCIVAQIDCIAAMFRNIQQFGRYQNAAVTIYSTVIASSSSEDLFCLFNIDAKQNVAQCSIDFFLIHFSSNFSYNRSLCGLFGLFSLAEFNIKRLDFIGFFCRDFFTGISQVPDFLGQGHNFLLQFITFSHVYTSFLRFVIQSTSLTSISRSTHIDCRETPDGPEVYDMQSARRM